MHRLLFQLSELDAEVLGCLLKNSFYYLSVRWVFRDDSAYFCEEGRVIHLVQLISIEDRLRRISRHGLNKIRACGLYGGLYGRLHGGLYGELYGGLHGRREAGI